MSSRVLTVEERLRSALVICHTLQHCALLADEAPAVIVPGFTPQEIVKQMVGVLDALSSQLDAAKAALPVEGLNLAAPETGGAR